MQLSVIIPVYNEINTFMELYRQVCAVPYEKEILIVDDGSTDGTREILASINDVGTYVFFNEHNRGKGYSIRQGIRKAVGEIVIIQDADLEYYPDEYSVLIKPIVEGKADAVYGSRFVGGHRAFLFWHYLGNKVINLITNIVLNTYLTDMMTCYKAMKRDVAQSLRLESDRFGIEPEITAELFKRGYKVYEVPISYNGRDYDEGKKITWKDFFRCIWWLLKASLRVADVGRDTLFKMRVMKNNNQWTFEKIRPYLHHRTLEIGSGIGTFSRMLASCVPSLVVSDIDERSLNRLKSVFVENPNVQVAHVDAVELPDKFGLAEFGSIVAINLLEHVGNDVAALAGAAQVCAPSGTLVLIVPAHQWLFGRIDKEIGHFRRYAKPDLRKKIESAGFYIEELRYMNFMSVLGWFVNFKLLKRKTMSALTLRLADLFIPVVARIEDLVRFPFGLSLFCVARKK